MHAKAVVAILCAALVCAISPVAAEDMNSNERAAAQACVAYAEAQEIYRRTDWDSDAVLEYSQTINGGKRTLAAPAIDPAKLPQPTAEEQKRIGVLIKQLGDDDFNTRENAAKALKELGGIALGELQAVARNGNDAEVISRTKQLIEDISTRNSPVEMGEGFGLFSNKAEGDIGLVDKALANAECPSGADPEKFVPKAGYLFRILKGQGANATGGKRSYVVNKNMTLGYGLIAFPKEYGKTGKHCFIINSNGTTFKRDFGDKQKTDDYVKNTAEFDPSTDWTPVD